MQNDFFKREDVLDKLNRPRGAFTFSYQSKSLMDKNIPNATLFEFSTGSQIFHLSRNEKFDIVFRYSTPGTGTRQATINIADYEYSEDFFFALIWKPEDINLYIGIEGITKELLKAKGIESLPQYQEDKLGNIVQIGDMGVTVLDARIYQGGQQTLMPTAINTWKSTLESTKILLQSTSTEGYMFEVIRANYILVSLVTGYEVFSKKRFSEIQSEGIQPDIKRLYDSTYSNKYRYRNDLISRLLKKYLGVKRETNYFEELIAEANEKQMSTSEYFATQAINFQNFDKNKEAYNKAYNIKFGEMGIDSQIIENVRKYIDFRHRIIHVSPIEAILNPEQIPREQPIFSNDKLAYQAIGDYSDFVDALHKQTLDLNRID